MTTTDAALADLQRRYDAAVVATNGLGLPAQIVRFDSGLLEATASMDKFVRPGGTILGPAQVTLVDGLAWLLLVSHMPTGADAYTTDLSVQFMRAVALGRVRAHVKIQRLGRRRAVVSTVISPIDDASRPISHLLLGFALRGNEIASHNQADRELETLTK